MAIGKWGVVGGVFLAAVGVGCGGTATTDAGPGDGSLADATSDSGRDAGRDGGGDMALVDLGPDASMADLGVDLGDLDLGADAGADLGDVDLGVDMTFDAGTDLGMVMMDAGTDLGDDAGPIDAGFDFGVDGGPPPPPAGAFVRVANLVANAPANPCFCLGTMGSFAGPPLETANIGDYLTGLPYGAVGDYSLIDAATVTGGALQIQLFDPSDIGSDCAAGLTVYGTLDPLTLLSGHTYTVAWVGLYDDGTGLPAICGAGFASACPSSATARLVLLDDDVTVPTASTTKTRVVDALANVGNIDVCWDPDGAGAMPAQTLATNLALGAASPYVTPSAIAAGTVLVYTTASGGTCAAHGGSALFTETVPFAAPAGVFTFSRTTLPLGDVHTIFADGWLPTTSANPPVIVPYHDAHP